jgi:hypothetical protein
MVHQLPPPLPKQSSPNYNRVLLNNPIICMFPCRVYSNQRLCKVARYIPPPPVG